MRNQKVLRGFALIAVALFFGLQAATYRLGSLSSAGAGLFPLLISGLVGLIGLTMLIQARFEDAEPMAFNIKNIALIMVSLIGFVLIAQHVSMWLAIPYLVFVASLAGSDYSWIRNLKICAALLAMGLGFQYFLGLNLHLL